MADFKIEILKQLEEGKITAQEALAMLGQEPPLNTPPPAFEQQPPEGNTPTPHSGNWIENLVGWVDDVAGDIVEGVQDLNIPGNFSDLMDGTFGHYKGTEVFVSPPVSQGISGLTLIGKNARVDVHGYEGDVIRVECSFNARHPDAELYFHEENGVFQLVYDEKMMRHMSIKCEVPRVMISEILIASKNGKVIVDGIVGGHVQLATKNDNIRAEWISCTDFIAQNRNAKIKTSNVNAENLHLQTTNASIKLPLTFADGWSGKRVIEAHTTNAGISFSAPFDTGIQVQASTSNGKITCQRHDMLYSEFSKGYVHGESRDYNMSSRKVKVRLATTNASVKILN
ncbi:MAG: hypothetical protein FWE05_10645 [Defluviitaleaceae bacterium]|nr:hypothetical protein [Defluviitaleaceae bacterium]